MSPELSTIPGYPYVCSKTGMRTLAEQSTVQREGRRGKAEFQELVKTRMSAYARREKDTRSVFLEICIACTDQSWTCENGILPFSSVSGFVVRIFFCYDDVIDVRSVAALRACLHRLELTSLRSPPSSRLRPGPSARGPVRSSSNSTAVPLLRQDRRRDLKDCPRLLDSMCQLVWWLSCTWIPYIFDNSCQSLQRFDRLTLTCGNSTPYNGSSCISLFKFIWICTLSWYAYSKFFYIFSSAFDVFSAASTVRRDLTRVWTVLWIMTGDYFHLRFLLKYLAFQDTDAFFRISPSSLSASASVETMQESGLILSLCRKTCRRSRDDSVVALSLWRDQDTRVLFNLLLLSTVMTDALAEEATCTAFRTLSLWLTLFSHYFNVFGLFLVTVMRRLTTSTNTKEKKNVIETDTSQRWWHASGQNLYLFLCQTNFHRGVTV